MQAYLRTSHCIVGFLNYDNVCIHAVTSVSTVEVSDMAPTITAEYE